MSSLQDIVELLDSTLRVHEIKDAPMALNGLQVENNGSVHKIAVAVDGSQKTIDDAIAVGADLLILHHGIYWCGLRPMIGWWKHKIESCLANNLAVYGAHLPLDMHPEMGNNISIARALGLQNIEPDLEFGFGGTFPGTLGELRCRYTDITGETITGVIAEDSAPAGRVFICSGGAGPEIYEVERKGYNTFLTGEENHWVQNAAYDMGMNLLFAGHYATETFGVKSIGEMLHQRFGLPVVFVDNPTGM